MTAKLPVILAIVSMGVCGPAVAQDFGSHQFYAGVLGGLATAGESGRYHGGGMGPPPPPPDTIYDFTLHPSGFSAGVLAGVEIPWQQFVIGVEADGSIVLGASTSAVNTASGRTDYVTINALGHLRGRFGMPMGGFTPFVATGLAIANIDQAHRGPDGGGGDTTWTQNRTLLGGSFGAGADIPVGNNMVIRAELLADGFPAQRFDFTTTPTARWDENVLLGILTVRAGVLVNF